MGLRQISQTFGLRFPVLLGCLTFVPGVYEATVKNMRLVPSARLCYSIWMRHIVKAYESGLSSYPSTVVELGPGGYLGYGIYHAGRNAGRHSARFHPDVLHCWGDAVDLPGCT